MTTLAADTPRVYESGNVNGLPVIAADIIYEGAAVGDNGSGYARPLQTGDKFRGFAEQRADNSSGSAGDINVRVNQRGRLQLSVSGAVITDVGQPVYATDDNTFTFSPVGGSFIGFVDRYVSSGVVVVRYDVDYQDPYGEGTERELVSDNKTLDAEDTGKQFFVDTDAKVITLPATATAGDSIEIVNIGADGTVAVNISPQAADKVMGPDLAGADNKDLINTKATANRGDRVVLNPGHADGWTVAYLRGTWATEA